jgi:hypothetical protein
VSRSEAEVFGPIYRVGILNSGAVDLGDTSSNCIILFSVQLNTALKLMLVVVKL